MEVVPLILTLLDKAIRQFSLYGSSHPQAQSAIRDLDARLKDFFGENEKLELAVKRTDLEWKGTAVLTIEKRENNFIQAMFLDGIRTLEWLPLITQEELKNFVSVLSRDQRSYESREDDTVTLFWKKGFQNIRYQTVDIHSGDLNALLRETINEEELTDDQKNDANYIRHFVTRLIEAGGIGNIDIPTVEEEGTPRGEFAEDVRQSVPAERFERDLKETDPLYQEAAAVSHRNVLAEVGLVFAEVLEGEIGTEAFPGLVTSYLQVVMGQLEKGDVALANEWLKRLRGVQLFVGEKELEAYAVIDEEINKAFSVEFFRLLTGRWNGILPSKPEEWTGLLTYVGDHAPAIILEILSAVPQETLHTKWVEFLIERYPKEIDVYTAALTRSEGNVVRDMVRILSLLLPETQLLPILVKVAAHPHAAVRLEVMRAASNIPSDKTTDLHRRAMKDLDEDVRLAALRNISVQKPISMVKTLAEQISKEEFLDRDATEKKRTLVALARCGGDSALEFMNQVVRETPSGDREHELRIAALYGIAEIGGPSAETLLDEYAGKLLWSKELRETARHLKERQSHRREESSVE